MKKLLILLIVPYSFVAAEVFEEEFPDGDLQEEYSLDGQACFDYIDNKGWSEGENTRKGKSFYVGVGIDHLVLACSKFHTLTVFKMHLLGLK